MGADDPDRLRNRMRPGLFDEWLAFLELEPIGERSRDEHMAYALAVLANAITGGKYRGKRYLGAYKLSDFLLTHHHADHRGRPVKPKEERLSPEATREYVAGLMSLMGGRDPKYTPERFLERRPARGATRSP